MASRVASYSLNDLPDEVLIHVTSFLPIKDAVCTSVLSRRWRYHFTFMTNIDIKLPFWTEDLSEFRPFLDFVDRLVLLPNIQSVSRFRVWSHDYIDLERFYRWICALVPSKIQELDIETNFSDINYKGLHFLLPESLFSCENLVVLKLNLRVSEAFELKVPAKICLPHLKVIHFAAIVFLNDGNEERIFPSCPVLEDLVVTECTFGRGCLKFNISSQSLKRVTLKSITSKVETIVPILINAPNMVFLSYSISTGHSLKLIDAKSLVEADIGSQIEEHDPKLRGQGHDIYDTAALGALSQMQNIQTLRINIRVLTDLQRFNVSTPLFDKMTCLKIWRWELGFSDLRLYHFLARCVFLETLVFEDCTCLYGPRLWSVLDPMLVDNLQYIQLGPLLQHLKTIEVGFFDMKKDAILMEVIEFFLKNAKVLEELKVSSRHGRSEQQVEIGRKLSEIGRKLRQIPTASEECRVFIDILK